MLPGEAGEQDLLDTMESLVRQLAEETQPPVIIRLLNTTRHGETHSRGDQQVVILKQDTTQRGV